MPADLTKHATPLEFGAEHHHVGRFGAIHESARRSEHVLVVRVQEVVDGQHVPCLH